MNRNSILIAVAVVLILVAGTVFVVNSGGETADNSAAADAPQLVACAACGHSWTVSFSEYEELTAGGKRIVCESCGAAEGWTAGGTANLVAPPTVALSDPGSSSEEDDDDDEYYPEATEKKPMKPTASAMKNPS